MLVPRLSIPALALVLGVVCACTGSEFTEGASGPSGAGASGGSSTSGGGERTGTGGGGAHGGAAASAGPGGPASTGTDMSSASGDAVATSASQSASSTGAGNTCEMYQSDAETALAKAKECGPDIPCGDTVTDLCGCDAAVVTGSAHIPDYNDKKALFEANNCVVACFVCLTPLHVCDLTQVPPSCT